MYILLVLILENLRALRKWHQQENYATCTVETLLSIFQSIYLAKNLFLINDIKHILSS